MLLTSFIAYFLNSLLRLNFFIINRMIKWSRTIQLYNVALFVREIPCDIGMKKPSPSSLKIYICRKAIYEVETNAGNNLLKFSEEMKFD